MKKQMLKTSTCLAIVIIFLLFNFNIPISVFAASNAGMSLSDSTPGSKDIVQVTIANGTTNAKDWVGLYNENDIPGDSSNGGVESIWWKYLSDLNITNGNGTFNFDLNSISGLKTGSTYKLVLFSNDTYNQEASIKFTITEHASPSDSNPAISISNSTPGTKDTIQVTIANGTTNAKDWVGLYNKDDKPDDSSNGGVTSIWWKYLPDLNIKNGNGTFNLDLSTISSLHAGNSYKLVLLENDTYTQEASVNFNISVPQASVSNIQEVNLKTKLGNAPVLPQTVTMTNSNGTSSQVKVQWDSTSLNQYNKLGSFTVDGTVDGTTEKAKADVTVIEGNGPLYSFQILSDTHLTSGIKDIHDVNFDSALKDINNIEPNSSRLIIDGDVVDSGLKANWDTYSQILNANKHSQIDAALGNHDTWQENSWIDQSEYNISKQNFLNYTGEPNAYYDYWLNGNHFIFLGSEQSDGNKAYISDTQLKWFDQKLAENASGNKPIFVFVHQPLYDTVAGSKPGQGWNDLAQDSQVREILAKYPQAIFFTGHTHYEFGSNCTMYNEKCCTMFNIPSCGYCWTDENTEDDISEGYYVDVYKDKVIVKGRNFTTKEWAQNAQFEVLYSGSDKNAVIKAEDTYASSQSKTPQLDNVSITADKTILSLNKDSNTKVTCSASMTNGTQADLSKAVIKYSSDNPAVVSVDNNGILTPVSKGLANITARVTINGITQSATQQIQVIKIASDAELSNITLDSTPINNFAGDTLSYNVMLSANTSKAPVVTATAEDGDAAVLIKQASSLNDSAVITVTATDGSTKKTYMVNFSVGSSIINTVEKTVFSLDPKPAYTKAQTLSISCATDGAEIRYTTDGTDPTENSKLYSEPISLTANTTVRAMAFKNGFSASQITSETYNISTANGAELINNADFSNGTAGWVFYDEAGKSQNSVADGQYKITIGDAGKYNYSIELANGNFKLSAGKKYRLSFDAKSTIDRDIRPVIEHNDAGYATCFDQVTAITSEMKTYSYDFTMSNDDDLAHLVFCMGNVDGAATLPIHDVYLDNVSLREIDDITADPVFSLERGTYSSAQAVGISCATDGAVIRYTTDGTDPTASSKEYIGPIPVTENTTIKAYASKDGIPDSKISGVTYKFAQAAKPIFSVTGGQYSIPQIVTISSPTEDAMIRYTIDGTDPTENSMVYSGPITVSNSTVIKARAYKEFHTDSDIVSAEYTILASQPLVPAVPIVNDNPQINNASTNNDVTQNTVTDITQSPIVSKDVFNSVKGQDKTITFNCNGTIWSFNGKDIIGNPTNDIDLSLKNVSDQLKAEETSKLKSLLGKQVPIFPFSFNYEGKLPGKTTVKIFAGTAWANKNVTVFRYFADKNTYEKIQDSYVDKDGYFSYITDHCSDYFIAETSNIYKLPQTGYAIDKEILFELGALLIIAGAGMVFVNRKRLE